MEPAFMVDGRVALASLMSLADGHLIKMADFLAVVASGDGRSARWEAIRGPLAEVGRHNVPAVLWFARPDGSYWTVGEGRVSGSLAGRAYFPRLMAGQTVIGDLVVSQSIGRSVAIVAVPIRSADGTVAGALGSSIHLDSLSRLLDQQMALPEGFTFYSIDATPIGALNRNPDLIFARPLTLGEDLSRAIREMLERDEGVVSYRFLDAQRTVLYRRSPITRWWYALGELRGETSSRAREVLLGGLFALTGSWSTQGQPLRAAMELAVEDVNRYLEGNAAGIRFVTAIEDTRLEPALALEKAKALRERGAQLLIGPQSSAEVAHLKPYVDSTGILLVSPASTAGTLAIAGDNVFRFTPSDSLEAVAISALMWADGIRAVVPVWRNDPGNAGLVRATRERFSALGGAVLDGVEYGVTTRDFSTTVGDLGAQLERAV
ncbi:MAG TPA: ABC transporter substrate-binding protein, partial [Gemmatimonadales bacterium]|nr:ABC transporter substrate-binding protein [Gemmatimonadales bacterium]